MRMVRVVVILLVLLGASVVFAQGDTCSVIVEQALTAVQDSCTETARNQACYGNISLQATARDGVPAFTFEERGDRVDIADITSLQLSSFDETLGHWGIALLQVQANIPNTIPGQNVTFILFGNVEIEDAVQPDDDTLKPMQAFRLRTQLGSTTCENVPEDGILIQTPEGAGQINLRVNDVDIELGSTIYLTAQPEQNMTVYVVEGEATVSAEGTSVTVPAGNQTEVPLNDDLTPSGEPSEATPYDPIPLELLPLSLLPEAITLAPSGGAAASPTQTPAPVNLNLNDPFSWASIPPEQLCPALDQELAAAGMSHASLIDMLEQLKGMEGANIPNIEAVQQAIRRCS